MLIICTCHKGIARDKCTYYILFMPKLEVTYDTQIHLTLERWLKDAAKEAARREGVPVNALIRQAIRDRIGHEAA